MIVYDFFLFPFSFKIELEVDEFDLVRLLSFELFEKTLVFLLLPLKLVLLLFSLFKSKLSLLFSLIFFFKASKLISLNDEINLFGCGVKKS